MIVVVIHWKIKSDRVSEFLEFWKTAAIVDDRKGLIGEVPQRRTLYRGIQLDYVAAYRMRRKVQVICQCRLLEQRRGVSGAGWKVFRFIDGA